MNEPKHISMIDTNTSTGAPGFSRTGSNAEETMNREVEAVVELIVQTRFCTDGDFLRKYFLLIVLDDEEAENNHDALRSWVRRRISYLRQQHMPFVSRAQKVCAEFDEILHTIHCEF